MKKHLLSIFTLSIFIVILSGCGKVNLLTLEQEKQLGIKSRDQVFQQYGNRVLNPQAYPTAYNYLYSIRDQILNSGHVKYRNDFEWEVYIIHDNTLNAFCTPGGYIFFYTGLLKYLEDGSSVAGVMGHEIAHADKRHSGKQITNQMGIDILLSIVSGAGGNQIAQVAGLLTNLGALKYSRTFENESDESSVNYLCGTRFQTSGASKFFEKLLNENNSSGPAIFSTHPDPADRIQNIQAKAAATSGCAATKLPYGAADTEYAQVKASLP